MAHFGNLGWLYLQELKECFGVILQWTRTTHLLIAFIISPYCIYIILVLLDVHCSYTILPFSLGYISTLRNNVRSRAWGAAIGCSYRVERCCIVKVRAFLYIPSFLRIRRILISLMYSTDPRILFLIINKITVHDLLLFHTEYQRYLDFNHFELFFFGVYL